MVNKVILVGRLGRDPELKYTQSGAAMCTLNLATDESYSDREGNRVDRTEWHRVQVWNKAAENCGNYLSKGSLVYVEGSLTTRKWQDQQGQDRYTTEVKALRVQFLDRRGDNASPRQNAGQGGYGDNNGGYGGNNNQNGGYGSNNNQNRPAPNQNAGFNNDMGSPFPSEASSIDEVPF